MSKKTVLDLLRTAGVGEFTSCPPEKLREVVVWIDATLTERGRKIVKPYYGLDEESRTFTEIGKFFGVTNERIRQIRDKELRKLRRSHALRVKCWRRGCPLQENIRREKSFVS